MSDTVNLPQLTEAGAVKVIDAARSKAAAMGVPQSIAVVDTGGNLRAFRRMDGAKIHSVETAQAKAYTAASIMAATGHAPDPFARNVAAATNGAWTNLLGGFPIFIDGVMVGAIGVGSGKPEEDIEVAQAGVAAVGSTTADS
jgi:uncharacterized protein GlcG (DUF336 family)